MSTIQNSAEPGANPANPTPIPPAPAPSRRRSGLNAAQQDELSKSREVLAAGRAPEHRAGLARRIVTDAHLDALDAAIVAADATGAATEGARPSRVAATREESTTRRALIVCLREFQACARRAYRLTAPEKLAAYKIGGEFNQSRALLEGLANAILAQATKDALPGLPDDSHARAHAALAAYRGAQVSQTAAGGVAETLTEERNRRVNEVKQHRTDLQLAVEAEWPSTTRANAAIRRKFRLPPRRPFAL